MSACPDGQHLWSICGAAPVPSCSPVGSNLPNQWCCP
jgi:hypothetical protein